MIIEHVNGAQKKRERERNQFLLCTKHWHFKDQAAIPKLGGLTRRKTFDDQPPLAVIGGIKR